MSEKKSNVNIYNRDFIYHIPHSIFLDLTLTLTDIRVYGIVRSFMDTTGDAYPSNAWLAKQLGVDPRTIRTSLARLIKKGFIQRIEVNRQRHLVVGRSIPMAAIIDKKPDLEVQGGGSKDPGGEDLKILQLAQSSTDSKNSNNSPPIPPKFRHQPALAAGDAAVVKILEKAAQLQLPSQSIEKLIKKYGRCKVDASLDLLIKKENKCSIKNMMGWLTDSLKEDWVENAPNLEPKRADASIEAQKYITEHRGTKLYNGALLALDSEGIKAPLPADFKGKEYEIFFNEECKFNIKLVDKMKELKQLKGIRDVSL